MSRTVRDVQTEPSALRRYRAERLLRKGFPELRSKVLAVVGSRLRAKGVSLDRSDLEACYAQAWQGLYATILAGEQVESPTAWLVLATFRRAIDESRSAARVAARAEAARAAGMVTVGGDLAGELDDRTRLREVFEAMRSRLTARECEAASLCYLQGLSRSEAAARMGMSDARMRKLMEGPGAGSPGVAGKLGELLATIQAGEWCEQQSSLMRAYAFGILDPEGERHALAVAHTRDCPSCRAHVAALRGLASVLPPLPLLLPFAAGARPWPRPSLGGGGSLSVKLAVGAAVVLATGSAILGLRSATPSARGLAGARLPAGEVGVRLPASGGHARARLRARVRPRAAQRARHAAARIGSGTSRSRTVKASAGEFSPERVRREALARAASSQPSSPVPIPAPAHAAGEFGIE
jgi:DNA-directed RNA polymerase specialized sigma24 family protein